MTSIPHPSPSPRVAASTRRTNESIFDRTQGHAVLQVLTAGSRERNNSRADCSSSISSPFSIVLFLVRRRIEDSHYSSSSIHRSLHLQLLTLHLQFQLLHPFSFIIVAELPKRGDLATSFPIALNLLLLSREPTTNENPRSFPSSSDCSSSSWSRSFTSCLPRLEGALVRR